MLFRLCPVCHAGLEFAEGLNEAELSCPSCLAKVPNPSVGIPSSPPTSSPTSAATTEAAPVPPRCLRCGQGVQAGWQYCPYCKAELAIAHLAPAAAIREGRREPWRQTVPQEQPLDTEVRKDTTGSGAILVVLACVLLVSVLVLFASGLPALGLMLIVLGAVVGGILLLSGVVQPKNAPSPADRSALAPERIGRIHSRATTASTAVGTGVTAAVGGCALGALVTAVVAIMLLMSVLAAIGNAIETCLTCGNPPAKHK